MQDAELRHTRRQPRSGNAAALELPVDTGTACVCAEAVGVRDQTLKSTAQYMNQRKQFGAAIARFQALRRRAADMQMQLELARSMGCCASPKIGAPRQERCPALSRARVQLGQAMRFVGQQSAQLYGGIGVTDKYMARHRFNKPTQLEPTHGDTLRHLGEVSRRMQGTAGVFACA